MHSAQPAELHGCDVSCTILVRADPSLLRATSGRAFDADPRSLRSCPGRAYTRCAQFAVHARSGAFSLAVVRRLCRRTTLVALRYCSQYPPVSGLGLSQPKRQKFLVSDSSLIRLQLDSEGEAACLSLDLARAMLIERGCGGPH